MSPIWINSIIIIIFGLVIGSLLNVVILRFDDLKSILHDRSRCPHCKQILPWYDLFPFFSWVALFGRCRFCKKEISLQYPLVELGTALIFWLIYLHFGLTVFALFLALISSLLIVIFTYDWLFSLISDSLAWIALGLWALWLLYQLLISHVPYPVILSSLYGGLALAGFLGLLVVASREKWMGAGDIKLGLLLGLMVGWPNVLMSTFIAFILGAIIGIILIALRKKKMQSTLPFAPFLIIGMFLTLFWGSALINWYLGRLF